MAQAEDLSMRVMCVLCTSIVAETDADMAVFCLSRSIRVRNNKDGGRLPELHAWMPGVCKIRDDQSVLIGQTPPGQVARVLHTAVLPCLGWSTEPTTE